MERITTQKARVSIKEKYILKNVIMHCIRGCGYLPHCGDHPGTPILIMFCIATGIAFINRNHQNPLLAFCIGFSICLLIFGSMYLYGAYERSVYDEQLERETNGSR